MRSVHLPLHRPGRQGGLATVEFAIVGLLVFTLLFGIIETGRAMFILNSAQEVTRRGARVAAVCPMNHPDVARVAVFGDPGGTANSPIINGLSTANISVEYLSEDGAPAAAYADVAFVRVSLQGFSYPLLFPLGTFDVPAFATTLPAESLGFVPEWDLRTCFGT